MFAACSDVSDGDAGLGRWFQVVAAQLFDPANGFFRTSDSGVGIELNSGSARLSNMGDHLRVFRFSGQFLVSFPPKRFVG